MSNIKERVFGIGMNKTGTSTLKHCFIELRLLPIASPSSPGLRTKYLLKQIFNEENYEPALQVADEFKAFEDRPWNVWDMYQLLDQRYPDSRFILTERAPENWWKSVHQWITKSKPLIAETYFKHLKVSSLSKEGFIESYLQYNNNVKSYFEGTDKLLVINLENGDGWDKLCHFLNLPIPESPFPHVNKQSYSKSDEDKYAGRHVKKVSSKCQNCNTTFTYTDDQEIEKRNYLTHTLSLPSLQSLKEAAARKIWPLEHKFDLLKRGDISKRIQKIQRNNPNLSLDDFAVVTCFFNPARFSSRVANFNTFIESLKCSGVAIIVVELVFGEEEFQLELTGVQSIRLRCNDIMWQKERLLNIGIQKLLSQGFKKIAWLDADIIFDYQEDWPWLVADSLEKHMLCQVFSHANIALNKFGLRKMMWSAMNYYQSTGRCFNQHDHRPMLKHPFGLPQGMSGYGWAARSELLEKTLLYDKGIIGGGDKMIYGASFPTLPIQEELRALAVSFYECPSCQHQNESIPLTEDYLSWAENWGKLIGSEPGLVHQGIKDLYHGERRLRKFMMRKEVLFNHLFDPHKDIGLDENGVWKWSSGKTQLHREVAHYFINRKEDL